MNTKLIDSEKGFFHSSGATFKFNEEEKTLECLAGVFYMNLSDSKVKILGNGITLIVVGDNCEVYAGVSNPRIIEVGVNCKIHIDKDKVINKGVSQTSSTLIRPRCYYPMR